MYRTDKYFLPLIVGALTNIVLVIILIFPLAAFALNQTKIIDAAKYSLKVGYLPKLIKFGIKSITVSDLALASKAENITTLLDHTSNAGRITQVKAYQYIKGFNSLDKGDELLLKCLQAKGCNTENYLKIINTSELHKEIALLHPGLDLWHINQHIGKLTENMMIRYFQRGGWTQLQGEIGRQGIDGLLVKKSANGIITDVMLVESKYNTSVLQTTQSGKQMSKEWALKKIENLKIKYPDSKEYTQIEELITRGMHRSRLWRMEISGNKIYITLDKIDSLDEAVAISALKGGEKTKIHYYGNSPIEINSPSNSFQEEMVKWYKEELNTL